MLLEQTVLGEIGCVSASGEHDRAKLLELLAILFVFNTDDLGDAALLRSEKLRNAGLLEDLDAIGCGDGEIFKAFHLGVGDDHSGELGTAAMGTWLRVAAETRDFREIEAESLLEPSDGVA